MKIEINSFNWIYCPRHTCVSGNATADSQASKAHINGTQTMGRNDILRIIPYNLMKCEMVIAVITQVRLLNWSIGYGASSRDRGRRLNHREKNQCATGTFSIHTLRLLLGVTGGVWAFPEYKNDDS